MVQNSKSMFRYMAKVESCVEDGQWKPVRRLPSAGQPENELLSRPRTLGHDEGTHGKHHYFYKEGKSKNRSAEQIGTCRHDSVPALKWLFVKECTFPFAVCVLCWAQSQWSYDNKMIFKLWFLDTPREERWLITSCDRLKTYMRNIPFPPNNNRMVFSVVTYMYTLYTL